MSRAIDTLETIMAIKRVRKKSRKFSQNYNYSPYYVLQPSGEHIKPAKEYSLFVALFLALPAYFVQHYMLFKFLYVFGYEGYTSSILWTIILGVLFASLSFPIFRFIKEGKLDTRTLSKTSLLGVFSLIVSVMVFSFILGFLTYVVVRFIRIPYEQFRSEINRSLSIFYDLDQLYGSLVNVSIACFILIVIEYYIYSIFLPIKDVMIFLGFLVLSFWLGSIVSVSHVSLVYIPLVNFILFLGILPPGIILAHVYNNYALAIIAVLTIFVFGVYIFLRKFYSLMNRYFGS